MSSLRAKAALVVGSTAALAAGVVGARAYFDEPAVTTGTVGAGVNVYECPMAGALSIGQVHAGDKVWLIGVTGGRWAVIRHPLDPDRPAWMPLALVNTAADTGDLPELGCADAVDLAGGAPTETTTATDEGSTTTVVSTVPLDSTTTSSSSTTTTIVADTTGPTVQITLDADVLSVCATLTAKVVVDDPTLPLSIISVRATWTTGGVEREKGFTRKENVSGNQFTLTISKAESGLSSGSVPLTVIVLARDGLNNRTTATLTIILSSVGC
ncbi:MAG: hypothetical protein Q7V57_13910 [Actinomycetota bacterium]|nr:hypothetical protein [Actinomycetota bacterium]